MLINIVVADRNWVLENIARQFLSLSQSATLKVVVSLNKIEKADIYYFLPYTKFESVAKSSKTVAFFTHLEEFNEEARLKFFQVAGCVDHCICMSKRYEKALREQGFNNVSTIYPGYDSERFYTKLRLGVVGRAYHTGRKNESLIPSLLNLPYVDVKFTGTGWPKKGKYYPDDELLNFYQTIDFLLVTSKYEGGPIPALEAIASGVEVIAPDVGFLDVLPHHEYENSNFNSLEIVLRKLFEEKIKNKDSLNYFSWDNFLEKHKSLFNSLVQVDSSTLHVNAILHGSESIARGGPSSRAKYTGTLLAQKGIEFNLTSGSLHHYDDVAHVFNLWPLKSCYKVIKELHVKNTPIVFSPILMDLSKHDAYKNYELLSNRRDVIRYIEIVKSVSRPSDLNFFDNFKLTLIKCCDLSDVIISLSEFEKRMLIELGISERKIVLAKNTVSPRYIKLGKRFLENEKYEVPEKLNIPFKSYVVTVGRIESRKNIISLCEYLADKDIGIIAIGAISELKYKETVERIYPGKVQFVGRKDSTVIASYIKECLAYVQVSWSEGASLATLEAYALGAKLLIADLSGESEFYELGDIFTFDAFSKDSFLKALYDVSMSKDAAIKNRLKWLKKLEQQYTNAHLKSYKIAKNISKKHNFESSIDITSLVHNMFNAKTTTGGMSLESNLYKSLKKLEQLKENVNFVCWSHVTNQFMKFENGRTIEEFMNDVLHTPKGASSDGEVLVNEEYFELAKNELVKKLDDANLFNGGFVYICMLAVKSIIKSFPKRVGIFLEKVLRKIQPKFNLNSTIGDTKTLKNVERPNPTQIHELFKNTHQIVVIGNAWLSNDQYVHALKNHAMSNNLNVKFIVYDILPITHPNYFPSNFGEKFESRLKNMIEISSHVFAISGSVFQELSSYLDFSKQRNKVKVERMQMGPLVQKSFFDNTEGTIQGPFVLYVSSINKRKNHDFLLRVWDKVSQNQSTQDSVKLVIVGNFSFGELDLPPAKNLIFIQNATDAEVYNLYQNCLFTVYPSKLEGYGLPVQESLEHGKICISSSLSSLDSLEHPGLIKLHSDDFFGWYETITAIIKNNSMRKSLEYELKNFSCNSSWDDIVISILKK